MKSVMKLIAGWLMMSACNAYAALPAAVPGQGPVPSLADMLEQVNPAVVNIATSAKATYRNPLLEDPFFRRFFRVPEMRTRPRSSGSGVVVDAGAGHIVTNAHVVDLGPPLPNADPDQEVEEPTYQVFAYNAQGELVEYTATIVSVNKDLDVALLKITSEAPLSDGVKLPTKERLEEQEPRPKYT